MVEIIENPKINTSAGCGIAYVDGSYNPADNHFSYGIVFFAGNREIHMKKAFEHEELSGMRNVAGEIMGSAQAMKTARKIGLKSLVIYHDYEGISKWCTGQWKAKKEWTKKYKLFYEEVSRDVDISFVKVSGHSGDELNDLADRLAKEALKIKTK